MPGSKVWLVSLGPKAKLQQVMMTVAQKVPFELVALDGPAGGFTDAHRSRRRCWPRPSRPFPGSTARGCWCSAAGNRPRAAPARRCRWSASGSASPTSSRAWTSSPSAPTARFEVLERIEGGKHQVSRLRRRRRPCSAGPPATCPSRATIRRSAWPTCAPSCRRCKAPSRPSSPAKACASSSVALPKQQRETRIVKDMSADEIAARNRRLDRKE